MCNPFFVKPVTPAELEKLRGVAAEHSINLVGTSGVVKYPILFGSVVIKWGYDENTETLSFLCDSKPFFISCDAVNSRLRELVAGALA